VTRAVAHVLGFEENCARIDRQRCAELPTFEVANHRNAGSVFPQMEQEAQRGR
jgi:hypothetical protein